jgi:MFS family permease
MLRPLVWTDDQRMTERSNASAAHWFPSVLALSIFFAITSAGDSLVSAASALFVYDQTGSKLILGAMEVAFWLPLVVARLVSVPLLDSGIGYRKLMFWFTLVECMATFGAGLLLEAGRLGVGYVFLIQVVKGAALGVGYPMTYALIPRIAPASRLAVVDSALEAMGGALLLMGPPLAAFVVKVFGLSTAYLVDGSSIVLMGVALFSIRERPGAGARLASSSGYFESIREAFGHLKATRELLAMSVVIGLLFLGERAIARQLLPYAVERLHSDVVGMGLLQSAAAVGYLAGGLFGIAVADRRRRRVAGMIFALASAVCLPMLALFHAVLPAAVVLGVFSIAYPVCVTNQNLVFQQKIPEQVRGGVIALGTSLNAAVGSIGGLIGGALAETVGLTWMFAGLGLTITAVFLWPGLWRRMLPGPTESPGVAA